MSHYFECNVVIDPVLEESPDSLKELIRTYRFYYFDSGVLSATSKDIEELRIRMRNLIRLLQERNYYVERYSIGDIIIDSHYEDSERLLKGASNGL